MKVLHMDRGEEMRGGQWQVLRLLRGQLAKGLAVELMTDPRGPLWEKAAADSIPLIPIGLLGVRRANVDLIHAHDARCHTLAGIGAKRTTPLVVSRRVAFPVQATLLSRWKYKRPTHYLAISEAVSNELAKAGVPREKISVVPDGITSPESVIPYEDRPLTPYSYLAIATEDPAKGSDLVRRAAALARAPVQFSARLADDVARARVFVYLSRSEGLGSAALIAMSYGVPVIASRVGGLVEVVEDGVSGLLTENDPEAVARALRQLIGSPALAGRMSQAARKRVTDQFSEGAMVERTIAVYRRVLD